MPTSGEAPLLADGTDRLLGRRMPRWVIPAVVVFWLGYLMAGVVKHTWGRLDGLLLLLLIALFLALAIEPGVNRLSRRGWRRGRATALILFGVLLAVGVFVGAIGTLVGQQVADLLGNSETYIRDTVDTINDTFGTELNPDEVVDEFNRRRRSGAGVHRRARATAPCRCRSQALNGLLQTLSVLLFTYYLVADGPRLRRVICSRLRPEHTTPRARRVGAGDHEDRWLPVLAGAAGAACRRCSTGSCSRRPASRRRSRSRCGSASSASSCRWSARTSPASCRC